jgi:hypothetical protein
MLGIGYVMLCYVMLCYVMLCYAMLCYAMLCYAMLCYVMLCYVICCVGNVAKRLCRETFMSLSRGCQFMSCVLVVCRG